jgi:GNAT superfamily N-acetyltransferase
MVGSRCSTASARARRRPRRRIRPTSHSRALTSARRSACHDPGVPELELQIRPRADADMSSCVEALRTVHLADRYPVDWPDDPERWLSPRAALGAWVAMAGSVVLGHVMLVPGDAVLADVVGEPPERLGAVARLFVSVPARGRGLALGLLERVTRAAVVEGLLPVLEVESGAAAAIALYERAGWRFVDTFTGDWRTAAGPPAVLRVYVGPMSSFRAAAAGPDRS